MLRFLDQGYSTVTVACHEQDVTRGDIDGVADTGRDDNLAFGADFYFFGIAEHTNHLATVCKPIIEKSKTICK